MVRFDADNLVYNRFDYIFTGNVERILREYGGETYAIDVHYAKPKATMNVWGKRFPQEVFEKTLEYIFEKDSGIQYIEINRAGNDYKKLLSVTNDIRIPIPDTSEQLLGRLNKKHRYTVRRLKRLLEEEYGKLEPLFYSSDNASEIPEDIVKLFFKWKEGSHGRSYHMEPKEYLKKYLVTDAMLLKAGAQKVGVLFFCTVEGIVYLENFSYDAALEKFSPGYLTYELLLEELVKRKCAYLYLGGGKYPYKKRFGAEESVAYSGTVYRQEVFDKINHYLAQKGIKKAAIYGLGVYGDAFLKLKSRLTLHIEYGIDKEKKEVENVPVYTLEDKLPEVDAVFITLKNRNKEAEDFLKGKFPKIYYWKDIVENMVNPLGNVQKD